MNAHQLLEKNLTFTDTIVNAYLGDLTDAELLVRPVPGINHIAWQLGHLIGSENGVMNALKPGIMPALPEGFREKHTPATAKSDDPKAFCTKAEYQRLYNEQRQGSLKVLATVSEADLDKPAPENIRGFAPTVGHAFILLATHPVMHGGQWAVIRRKLGRPPLF